MILSNKKYYKMRAIKFSLKIVKKALKLFKGKILSGNILRLTPSVNHKDKIKIVSYNYSLLKTNKLLSGFNASPKI